VSKPRRLQRSVEKTICLDEDLVRSVDLLLFSEVERRVPFGAWKAFLTTCIQEKLEKMRAEVITNTKN